MSVLLTKPVVGLIVPPAQGAVPPEAAMYPEIHFIAEGLGLSSVEPDGYDLVIDLVIDKAQRLVERGAQAVSLMGTSLSFYRGNEQNNQLVARMKEATGVPCSTMSHAIVSGLHRLQIKKVAVASSYIDVVNQHLKEFLAIEGLEALSCQGLGETGVEAMGQISTEDLVQLCLLAYEQSQGQADGILLSCGGLRTLETIREVERQLNVPVVASSPAGFWDAAGLVQQQNAKEGFGRLAALV